MELAKLGHVAYTTPDLERSVWFFRDVVGLEEVERHQDTVFLRAWGDWEHHTLSLARGDQVLVDHVAWRTKRPEDVEEFAGRLKSQGTEVEWIEAGAERGQGRAIRFELPSGNTFELYYEMEKTPAPEHRKSRLKNLPSRAYDSGISPRRIDHVNINVPDPPHVHRWLDENLGFKMREYLRLDNGYVPAGWMSFTPLSHDIAVMQDPQGRPDRFHHVAYFADGWQDVLRGAEIYREQGVPIDVGPGKHGGTHGFFLYAKDPGSGHRLEIVSGGYLIFDPDWEPIEWTEKELQDLIIWYGPPLPEDFLADSTGPESM